MLHWLPSPTLAFAGARTAPAILPGDRREADSPRARHALMLAYAAQRRRAAAEPADSRYWKAAAPVAVEKARKLRQTTPFARLP